MRVGIKCVVNGDEIPDEECLRCRIHNCDRVGQECGVPYEMLKGIQDSSGRSTAFTSATMLTNSCPRRVWLEKNEDYFVNPLTMFPAFRGTMGHQITESYPEPGCIYEQRFETIITVNGQKTKITGALDKLDITNKKIEDFKTKGDSQLTRLKAPEPSHTMQLNIYRWLVWNGWPQKKFVHDGRVYKRGQVAHIPIESLRLNYWSMGKIKMLYPELLSLEEVEAYVYERAANLLGEIPPIPANLDPLKSTICTQWCAVRDHCLQHEIGF